MGILDRLWGLITRGRTDASGRSGSDDSAPETPGVDGPIPERPGRKPPTDRGQVLRLLVRHDGSIRKSDLIEEIDLEESEVVRVLSEMEDDGDVRMVPYGKNVLVCRPGYEPPGQRRL